MKRREAGFSFIEVLVVMGIIVVLMGMVAVVVPRVREQSKQTQSTNNVKNLVTLLVDRSLRKSWPRYDGKNFHLSLLASGTIESSNADNLEVFFSPGDTIYTLELATPERFKDVTIQALNAGTDFHDLTSYAGRRNSGADREWVITPNKEKIGVPIVSDDDDGPVHHPAGMIIGYTNGSVKFKEWADLGMSRPENPDDPEPFLGDEASVEELRGLSSE